MSNLLHCACPECGETGDEVPLSTAYFHMVRSMEQRKEQERLSALEQFDSSSDPSDDSYTESTSSCESDIEAIVEGMEEIVDDGVQSKWFCREVLEQVSNKVVTQTGAEALLTLVHNRYGDRLAPGVTIPHTFYMLKKHSDLLPGGCTYLEVCASCDGFIDEGRCPDCYKVPSGRVPREMLVTNIKARLKRMYSVPAIGQALEYPIHRQTGDGDVWDGLLLREKRFF